MANNPVVGKTVTSAPEQQLRDLETVGALHEVGRVVLQACLAERDYNHAFMSVADGFEKDLLAATEAVLGGLEGDYPKMLGQTVQQVRADVKRTEALVARLKKECRDCPTTTTGLMATLGTLTDMASPLASIYAASGSNGVAQKLFRDFDGALFHSAYSLDQMIVTLQDDERADVSKVRDKLALAQNQVQSHAKLAESGSDIAEDLNRLAGHLGECSALLAEILKSRG